MINGSHRSLAMPHYSSSDFPFHGAIGYLLSQCSALKNRIYDKQLARHDLSISATQFDIIALIGSEQASTPSQLCQCLSIDSGPMTRLLDRLERKTLIRRQRSPSDRRQVDLTLTEQGVAIYRMAPDVSAAALNEMTEPFTEDELDTLCRLLDRLQRWSEAQTDTRSYPPETPSLDKTHCHNCTRRDRNAPAQDNK